MELSQPGDKRLWYVADAFRHGFSLEKIHQLTFIDPWFLALIEDIINSENNLRGYKRVDTCAAEFESNTAYMYSTYDEECEAAASDRDKIVILGGGPNRIGQGIEFDYCCVHAALSLRDAGYETIMVNCNRHLT